MSELHIVPALVALGIVLLASSIATAVAAWAVGKAACGKWGGKFQRLNMGLTVVAAGQALGMVVVLFTALGLSQQHFEDHCHALGGVVDHGGDHECVKPHSFIDNA